MHGQNLQFNLYLSGSSTGRETKAAWDFGNLHHGKGGAWHFGLPIPSESFKGPGHEYENSYD